VAALSGVGIVVGRVKKCARAFFFSRLPQRILMSNLIINSGAHALNGPQSRIFEKAKAWYRRERSRFRGKRVRLGWIGFVQLYGAIDQMCERWGINTDRVEEILDECVDLELTYAENVKRVEEYMLMARAEKLADKPRAVEEMVGRSEEEVKEWLRGQLRRMAEEVAEEVQRMAPPQQQPDALPRVWRPTLRQAQLLALELRIKGVACGREVPITDVEYRDYLCRRCGSSWSWEAVWSALLGEPGEMTYEEAEKFMKGLGCPKCRGRSKLKRARGV